jgi:hypothetical protein
MRYAEISKEKQREATNILDNLIWLLKFTHWQTCVCHNKIKLSPTRSGKYVSKRNERRVYKRLYEK